MADNIVRIIFKGVDEVSDVAKGIGSSLSGLGGMLGTAAVGVGLAAVAVGGAVVAGIGVSINKAMEAEAENIRWDILLKNAPDAANYAASSIEPMIDALMKSSVYDDEAIRGVMAMGAAAGVARKDVGPFTQSVLDLAAATGMDLPSATKIMATAMDEPTAAIARFEKMGLRIPANIEAQIAALEQAGDKAGAYALLMESINGRVGGSAEAVANTVGGKWQQLKVIFDNFMEDVGSNFLPIILPVLEQFAAWASANLPIIAAWISETLVPAFRTLVEWLAGAGEKTGFLSQAFSWLQTAIGWLTANVLPVLITIVQNVSDVFNNVWLPILRTVWNFLKVAVFPILAAIANVIGAVLSKAVQILAGLWENVLMPAFTKAYEWIKKNLQPTLDKLAPVFDGIAQAVERVVGWLGTLAENIRNIKLPDWLTPGSPTPFELGLRGIADALKDVNALGMPVFGGRMAPAYGGAGGVSTGGNDASIAELRAIRDDIHWMTRNLPRSIEDASAKRR